MSQATMSVENAEHYHWGNDCDGWHLAKSDRLSVIQERVPSKQEETRHYHNQAEQFFYVLNGIATIECSDVIHTVSALQGIHIPPGVPHQLRNATDHDLEFLVISTPLSHGDRVEA